MSTRLSVNLNAVALLRNRRNLPWPSVTSLGRIALEAGAEDIESDEGIVKITCPPEEFIGLNEALTNAGMQPESSEVVQKASLEVDLSDDDAEKVMKLIDALEDNDDVQNVIGNFRIPDEVQAVLNADG